MAILEDHVAKMNDVVKNAGDLSIATTDLDFASGEPSGRNLANLSISTEYINLTTLPLCIQTQNNLVFSIPSMHTRDTPRKFLELKVTYTIKNASSIRGTIELLEALDLHESLRLQLQKRFYIEFSRIFRDDVSRDNKYNFTFTLFYRIDETQFVGKETLYLRELDVVVTTNRVRLAIPHPNSHQGLDQALVQNTPSYQGHSGVFIRVIDNDRIADRRYYYSGKQLVTVPSETDRSRESGVYSIVSTLDKSGRVMMQNYYHTFEEAVEAYGLYYTQEDARSNGDPELLLRVEDKRISREIVEKKNSHELTSIDRKETMESTSSKSQLERLELELEKIRLQAKEDRKKLKRDAKKEKRVAKEQLKALKEKAQAALYESEQKAQAAQRDSEQKAEALRREHEQKLEAAKREHEQKIEAAKRDQEQRLFAQEQETTLKLMRAREENALASRRSEEQAEFEEHRLKLERLRREEEEYFNARKRRRDDYYEDRSSVRKDSSELIKYAPAMAVGLATAAALIFNGRSAKS